MVRKDKAYLALEGNKSGSRPKELYGDCMEEVEERFTKERGQLKEAVRKYDIPVTEDSTLEAFTAALKDSEDPQYADIQEAHRCVRELGPERKEGCCLQHDSSASTDSSDSSLLYDLSEYTDLTCAPAGSWCGMSCRAGPRTRPRPSAACTDIPHAPLA